MSDVGNNPVGSSRVRSRPRNRATSSALVSADAADKIAKAAGAVGLSAQELVELVSDSGLMATPPDGVTEVLSLEDLGARLHNLSCAQPRSQRAAWFAGLVATQQEALLTVLRERGYATAVIAQDYDIDPMTVVNAHNKFADNLGKNVINIRLSTIAGHMQLAMERAQQGAMEKSDWGTYWRIHKEAITLLQTMGVVDRAAQKIEVDNTINIGTQEKELELERILDIARRGDKRRLEITQTERESDDVEPIQEAGEAGGEEAPGDDGGEGPAPERDDRTEQEGEPDTGDPSRERRTSATRDQGPPEAKDGPGF